MTTMHDEVKTSISQAEAALEQWMEKTANCADETSLPLLLDEAVTIFDTYEDALSANEKQVAFFSEFFQSGYCRRNDFSLLFDKTLRFTEKTGNADWLASLYLSLDFLREPAKKIASTEEGIRKLLALQSNNNAGRLFLRLAWADLYIEGQPPLQNKSYNSIEKRIRYCQEALQYLNRTSLEYAAAIATQKYLALVSDGKDILLRYHVFGTQARCEGMQTYLAYNFCAAALTSGMLPSPLSHDTHILSGYDKLDPPCYQGKEKIILDRTLPTEMANSQYEDELVHLADNTVVSTEIGSFTGCHVFAYKHGGQLIKNYFAPAVGLVRVDVEEQDTAAYSYVLCDYVIKGGEGLLPLHTGNMWRYRQSYCPDWAGQVIEREVVHTNGACYQISGLDYVYFNSENASAAAPDDLSLLVKCAPWLKAQLDGLAPK